MNFMNFEDLKNIKLFKSEEDIPGPYRIATSEDEEMIERYIGQMILNFAQTRYLLEAMEEYVVNLTECVYIDGVLLPLFYHMHHQPGR